MPNGADSLWSISTVRQMSRYNDACTHVAYHACMYVYYMHAEHYVHKKEDFILR